MDVRVRAPTRDDALRRGLLYLLTGVPHHHRVAAFVAAREARRRRRLGEEKSLFDVGQVAEAPATVMMIKWSVGHVDSCFYWDSSVHEGIIRFVS